MIMPARTDRIHFETLQVVFKVVERCNINCTYCYYFNGEDQSAILRPAVVSLDTAAKIAEYLASGVRALGTKRILISFHGGEPMLLKPRNFGLLCDMFRQHIEPHARLGFTIQTNGTILSKQWLELFARYEVNMGISTDGHREAHDRFRLDHKGRSTFDRTDGNLRALVRAAGDSVIPAPSTISVLNAGTDYKVVYRYLRNTGIRSMSFLFPDRSIDMGFPEDECVSDYGKALSDIANAWFDDDDTTVSIRQVSHFLEHVQERVRRESGTPSDKELRAFGIIVVQSDGHVAVNDSYMPTADWYMSAPKMHVEESTLPEFLNLPIWDLLDQIELNVPDVCTACRWVGVCKGGDLENRYSSTNGFDNPSVYCSALQEFFSTMEVRLCAGGYPSDLLSEKLEYARNQFLQARVRQ